MFDFPQISFNQLKLRLAVAKRNNLGVSLYNNWIILGKIMEVLLPLNYFHLVGRYIVIYIVMILVFIHTPVSFIIRTVTIVIEIMLTIFL